ncbi:MAG: hypothetical protein IJY31_00830 [Muribaculaceae bacterium]|nr:hypothetical protein [Muribaculaceae bacterium]
MAQSRYARHISKAGASFTAKNQSLKTGYSPICSKIVPLDSDESAPLMHPRQEEEWLYEGDWTKGGDNQHQRRQYSYRRNCHLHPARHTYRQFR